MPNAYTQQDIATTPIPRLRTNCASSASGFIGRVIGKYRICKYLQRGGTAVVYKAQHRLLGHHVALKVLRPEYLRHTAMLRRFYNEARTIAAIEHPGLVRYYDIGRTSEGYVYLVMELLDGETLGQRLARGALSEQQTAIFARQMASALAAAHARGIVHRDIKPENIVLVADPEVPFGERTKVLDFGIAKAEDSDVTSPGVVIGTPAYMAPEQCQPGRAVDARTDIYSLGALMFQMVTGQLLFRGKNDHEVLHKHQYEPPPSPRALGIQVSAVFDEMLTACLAKNPDERHPSMEVLAQQLETIESMTESPISLHQENAVPYPVQFDQSSPQTAMACGTMPPAVPDYSLQRSNRMPTVMSSDITVLRSGLEQILGAEQIRQLQVAYWKQQRQLRLAWSVLGGLTMGSAVIWLMCLFG